jgi:putative endonuclease
MTSNLIRRIEEHRTKLNPKSFTAKYNCVKLVYLETGESAEWAIIREKEIKDMRRERKIELIETTNPKWEDLSDRLE